MSKFVLLRDYIFAQLQQSSTWRGLILLVGVGGGRALAPESMEAVITLSVMASGAVAVLFPDKVGSK